MQKVMLNDGAKMPISGSAFFRSRIRKHAKETVRALAPETSYRPIDAAAAFDGNSDKNTQRQTVSQKELNEELKI